MTKWIAPLFGLLVLCSSASAEKSGFIVDTIIATVDDKPITLVELGKHLTPPRSLTISQASTDPEAIEALNGLIMERMLSAEAERRNIKVSDEDVTQYIEEVKKKNGLTDEALEAAIKGEKKSMAEYKETIRMDILRSKISANFIRSSAAVTDEEISEYIKQGMSPTGKEVADRVHIRQIFLSNEKYTPDEARAMSEKIRSEFEDGTEFEKLAAQYSDDPQGKTGGDMGLVAEKDLSPTIFDAILPLKDGEVSFLVSTKQGFSLYQMVERVKAHESEDDEDENSAPSVSDALKAQVRQKLEQEKMQAKMISFIETELPKLHTVEKRI